LIQASPVMDDVSSQQLEEGSTNTQQILSNRYFVILTQHDQVIVGTKPVLITCLTVAVFNLELQHVFGISC
jgi:hypothetical protein